MRSRSSTVARSAAPHQLKGSRRQQRCGVAGSGINLPVVVERRDAR